VIRVAVPSKGRLLDPTLALLAGAGYRAADRKRGLFVVDPLNDVEFVFLRPIDIPVYVAGGELDAGITGEDLVLERDIELPAVLDLDFGQSRLCVAVPDDSPATTHADLAGLRVATSFPRIAQRMLPGPPVIVELAGSVEAAVRLGVADAILDVVDTGSTLLEAGLRVVGDPLLESTVRVFVRPDVVDDERIIDFRRRLQGRLLGQAFVMLEYDVHGDLLEQACALTPGIESPTVARLERDNWFAVRSMVPRAHANAVMSALAELGAKAIVLTKVENALEIHD
jgi:ATP phosphoribosyltransferase